MKKRTMAFGVIMAGIAAALVCFSQEPQKSGPKIHAMTNDFTPDPEVREPEFATVEKKDHTVIVRALDSSWELVLPRAGHVISPGLHLTMDVQVWPKLNNKQRQFILEATRH